MAMTYPTYARWAIMFMILFVVFFLLVSARDAGAQSTATR
jgi:hypothetical protein